MTQAITLNKIKREVFKMDRNLKGSEDVFKSAVLLLAAAVVGPNEKRLAEFTRFDPAFVRERVQRLRGSGIFRRGKIADSGWDDAETGGIAFWLDVGVAEGWFGRSVE